MDPEEAKARAASRRASRMASRERGEEEVVPVEELGERENMFMILAFSGCAKGYEDILMGYGARSRQQSTERGAGKGERSTAEERREEEKRKRRNAVEQERGRERGRLPPVTREEDGKQVEVEEEVSPLSDVKKPPTAPRRKKTS